MQLLVSTIAVLLFTLFPISDPEPFLMGDISNANPDVFTPSLPGLVSEFSPLVRNPWPGMEWVVTSTFKNNDDIHDWSAYFVVEVRDPNGMTILLELQSVTVNAGDSIDIGVGWTPLKVGTYEMKTFAISNLENPQILSGIRASEITISARDDALASETAVVSASPIWLSDYPQLETPVQVGDDILISTILRNPTGKNVPILIIFEARNSDGTTELTDWVNAVILANETEYQTGIGWIPSHADSYQLRTFVISNFGEDAMVVSKVEAGHAVVE